MRLPNKLQYILRGVRVLYLIWRHMNNCVTVIVEYVDDNEFGITWINDV